MATHTMTVPADLRTLQKRLGHRFKNPGLLTQALTHASARNKTPAPGAENLGLGADYERLEFLGDRVLGLVVAERLLSDLPDAPVGEVAARFKVLVSRATCTQIARAYDMGAVVLTQSGLGRKRLSASVLADVCEAIIGALYLDAGYKPAARFIVKAWAPVFALGAEIARADAKSDLQILALRQTRTTPAYHLVRATGPGHKQDFTMRVSVPGLGAAEGRGTTRQSAEQEAARALLKTLESKSDG